MIYCWLKTSERRSNPRYFVPAAPHCPTLPHFSVLLIMQDMAGWQSVLSQTNNFLFICRYVRHSDTPTTPGERKEQRTECTSSSSIAEHGSVQVTKTQHGSGNNVRQGSHRTKLLHIFLFLFILPNLG